MALKFSGAISFSDIKGEFNNSNPVSLSEFYQKDYGMPTSGTISVGDFYGKERGFANVRRMYVKTTAINNVNTTIDTSWCQSSTPWMVVCYAYGEGGGASISGTPVYNGTSLASRAYKTTYYSDDGAAARIWASPITKSASGKLTFSNNYGTYNNATFVAYVVDGAVGGVQTITKAGNRATSITVPSNQNFGCAFVANASHKSGRGSVSGEDSLLTNRGCSCDRYVKGANVPGGSSTKTFTIYGQACCAIYISYGTNNPVLYEFDSEI